jgi:NADH dehydrogenase
VTAEREADLHRVVIVGGGFGGLYAAKELLRDKRVEVTLVDRRNFHTFQPLLYQVATGALAPGDIATPLRAIVGKHPRARVLLGMAEDVNLAAHEVLLSDGGTVPYDTLIVATGARFSYFGNDAWAPFAPGLKTIDDATEIRRRIFIAFEAAEREANDERREEWMTFVIVGGGPTGVELAGALGEIAHDTLKRNFRAINPADARIVLVEALPRILPTYPEDRSASAAKQLARLGVTVRTDTTVVHIDEHCVEVEHGGDKERLPARTVLWAAGVSASTFARKVAQGAQTPTDKAGRAKVNADLTLGDHQEVFVLGDAALMAQPDKQSVPGVAQGAIQSGKYAARLIRRRLSGESLPPFRYQNRGDVAIIGRLAGVTDIPWLGRLGRASGFPAWLLWLGIHIVYLIGFANRIVVVVRWAWSFITRGRGSRLITGQPLLPEIEDPEPIPEPIPEPELEQSTRPVE